MPDVLPYLQRIMLRFNDPSVQASLKGFTRSLLFKFTDTNESWLVRVVEGKEASLARESLAEADVTVTTTTEVLAGIMDRRINALAAYMQHKIQAQGPMEDLVKMQKLLW